MSRGVFAVSRSVWDHHIFAVEPFTEREAWMWLVGEAAWRNTRVRVGVAVIDLNRGQCAFSSRFLATKWQWAEAKVRRFLNRLKTDAMIVADIDAGVTRITICKYKEYQRVSLPDDAPTDAPTDAGPTQDRRKEEDREYTEDKEVRTLRGAIAPMAGQTIESQIFAVGKKVLGKSAGGQITKIRKLFDYQDAEVLAFIQDVLADKENPSEYAAAFINKNQPENRAYRGAANYRDNAPEVVWVDFYRAKSSSQGVGHEHFSGWTPEDERAALDAVSRRHDAVRRARDLELAELREMGAIP